MKPSELVTNIFNMDRLADEAESEANGLRKRAEVLSAKATSIRTHKRTLLVILDTGSMQETEQKYLAAMAEIEAGKTDEPEAKPARKTRSDQGVPRGPRRTQGKALDEPLLAKLYQTLDTMGPMQLPEIEKLSWTGGLSQESLEGLLVQDPSRFVAWEDGEQGGLTVWGTTARFDKAVGSLTLQCRREDRAKYTASTLGCSLSAAADAWKRLDPGSSANA